MRLTLYQLRYRYRMLVEDGFIEASSLEMAEKLGREWCSKDEKRRYISIRDTILVREDVPIEKPADPVMPYNQGQRKVG